MKHFKQLDYPSFNIAEELQSMLDAGIIDFDHPLDGRKMTRQICLNTIADEPANTNLGAGSLVLDWTNGYIDEKTGKRIVPKRERILEETDFNTLCVQFEGTEFEKLYNFLNEKYVLGRVRVMQSDPKTCLTWHTDTSPRIHYVIKTQPGCQMVIEDEVIHMPEETWWHADTVKYHTAFNGSVERRIHIVAGIIAEK